MGFKPFKWIKKHPWESAAILALAGTGLGAAGIGPMAGLFAGEGAAAGAAGAAGAGEAATGAGIGGSFLGAGESLLGPVGMGMADLFPTAASAPAFAQGALTTAPGALAGYGPGAVLAKETATAPWMTPQKAMQLARFSGLGQQQPQQRPLGGPVDAGNPWQRPAMATQEQITKKWLMQNDPTTYARLYGQQGAM